MSDNVIVIRGTTSWCKLLGEARPHTGLPRYDKGPFWSIDITPDAKSRELISKYGIEGKLRDPSKSKSDKETRKETYLTLKQLLKNGKGGENKPPVILDITGSPWNPKTEIGNGSVVDVMIKIVDYGPTVEKGVYLQKMRVLKLVEYGGGDFEEVSEDDEFFAAGREAMTPPTEDKPKAEPASSNIDDLDDDVPF